jgi:hypothetical protein
VKVSSELYQKKEDWMLQHQLISQKGGTRGRKSTKRPNASTTETSTQKPKRRRQNEAATTTTADTDLTNILNSDTTI